ncbi:hypothetical protein KM043_004657 [Ampulex compressa]|nr:hypothetical protein KM043_004657 [Ampulex compressa]
MPHFGRNDRARKSTRFGRSSLSSASSVREGYEGRSIEMHVTQSSLYALRLTFSQGAHPSMLRRNIADRNTTKSALFLATIGLGKEERGNDRGKGSFSSMIGRTE